MSNNQTTVVDLVGQIPSHSDHPLAAADSAFLPSIPPNEGKSRGGEGEGFVFLVGPTDGHLFFFPGRRKHDCGERCNVGGEREM